MPRKSAFSYIQNQRLEKPLESVAQLGARVFGVVQNVRKAPLMAMFAEVAEPRHSRLTIIECTYRSERTRWHSSLAISIERPLIKTMAKDSNTKTEGARNITALDSTRFVVLVWKFYDLFAQISRGQVPFRQLDVFSATEFFNRTKPMIQYLSTSLPQGYNLDFHWLKAAKETYSSLVASMRAVALEHRMPSSPMHGVMMLLWICWIWQRSFAWVLRRATILLGNQAGLLGLATFVMGPTVGDQVY
ncbi:hypothetical protein BKA56DRAFT_623606 [Ilyonectria sp. MPI-CAGE-AT-0026]|nr:hypothetical protein BKA56DRAFT_623606 [Ilyonectria sp. MPI-CAGE-AT-0026]